MASQAIMLALRGIPAVYFHSLIGTANDHDGVARTGRVRSINRRKFTMAELQQILEPPSMAKCVFDEHQRLISVRRRQPAFHPDSPQRAVNLSDKSLIAFLRGAAACGQTLLVIANLSEVPISVDVRTHGWSVFEADLIAQPRRHVAGSHCEGDVALLPYQVAWLPVIESSTGTLP
jgi:sucrose phosphorylase